MPAERGGAKSWANLIAEAATRMAQAGVAEPGRDARLLARWAAGIDGAALSATMGDHPPAAVSERFLRGVEGRANRRPLSHITGERAFWGHLFRVSQDVLDPRPETEILVAAALERPFERVLDLGTGSGCILLSLLAERPEATGLGTDLSAAALAIARENADRLDLRHRAAFHQADWGQALSERFDLIVSNPPYLAEGELSALEPEVARYEPQMALSPGGDGLDAYRSIAAQLTHLSAPGARVLLEIGPTQAESATELLRCQGFAVGPPRLDFDGRDRVIEAFAPQNLS